MHLQFAYDLLFVHLWLFGLFGNSWAFCNHISKTVFVTMEMTSETSSHNNINSLITAPLTKDTEGLKIILSLLACWQTYFKPKPSSLLSQLLFLSILSFWRCVCSAAESRLSDFPRDADESESEAQTCWFGSSLHTHSWAHQPHLLPYLGFKRAHLQTHASWTERLCSTAAEHGVQY